MPRTFLANLLGENVHNPAHDLRQDSCLPHLARGSQLEQRGGRGKGVEAVCGLKASIKISRLDLLLFFPIGTYIYQYKCLIYSTASAGGD